MQIDPCLNDIDDCLYRVSTKAIIVQDGKVLLTQEIEKWWSFPGGGVDYGETVEQSLPREVEEELGIPAEEIHSDFKIVYYNIGKVVNNIPRMNIFYRASLPAQLIKKTDQVTAWGWFTSEE